MDKFISVIVQNIVALITGLVTLGICYASWKVWQTITEARIKALEEKQEDTIKTMEKLMERLESMEQRMAVADKATALVAKESEIHARHYEKVERWLEIADTKFDKIFEQLAGLRGAKS